MKFPRLSRKTWIAIGLVVLLVVLVSWSVKEGFESGAQYKIFMEKLDGFIKTPHFEQLKTMYPRKEDGFGVLFKFIMPLQAVGYYGDVTGNDLQVKQSQLESMLNGTFPIDSVLTLEKAYQVAQVMHDGDTRMEGRPPINKTEFMNDPNVKNFYIDFPKGLYYMFAKGQVSPNATPEQRAEAQKQFNDPNDKINKQWTEQEKEWLRKGAGMLYTIIPDTPAAPAVPSPSTPSSSANYSATCNKCTVMNNQITCACDVLPK